MAAVGLGPAGCSKPDTAEAARTRADLEATKADVARLRAQLEDLRAELEVVRVSRPAPKAPDQARTSLAGRFEAASALADIDQRQTAFATLAVDAATRGDADTNKKCIDKLTDIDRRQTVIYRSALRLAAADQGAVALALAKSLSDIDQRQKALAKIAQADYRE